jgi:hypothetical protein
MKVLQHSNEVQRCFKVHGCTAFVGITMTKLQLNSFGLKIRQEGMLVEYFCADHSSNCSE